MTKISDVEYNNIALYMRQEIREWAEERFLAYAYEVVIAHYYLKLLREHGLREADDFDDYMFITYGYDIDDYVSHYQKDCALSAYEARR